MVCQDEASLSNTATLHYQWSEQGHQPKVVQKQRQRERCSLFGCVEPQSGRVITGHAQRGNASSFFSFLLKVASAYGHQKVYMVLDNASFHHARRLQPVLERYSHRLELVFLPAYSPDLNPMERIWWYMRKKITHNRFIQSLEERIQAFNAFFVPFQQPNLTCITIAKLPVNLYCT